MGQFSVHKNTNEITKDKYPYLIDVQNQLLESLETHLVIPLVQLSKYEKTPIKDLMPIVVIDNKQFVLLTPQMAGIHKKYLGTTIAELQKSRQEIVSAIDFLLTGF